MTKASFCVSRLPFVRPVPLVSLGAARTFDLRLFMNLEQQQSLAGDNPGFLKDARLSLRVDNLFDAQQRVTDETGTFPLSY